MTISSKLEQAIREHNPRQVQELLQHVDNINLIDTDTGQPFLNEGAISGNPAVVQTLLDFGADVDSEDSEGFTALMFASKLGYLEIVQILVRAGAKADSCDKAGNTALLIAAWASRKEVVDYLSSLYSDRESEHAQQVLRLQQERSSNYGD